MKTIERPYYEMGEFMSRMSDQNRPAAMRLWQKNLIRFQEMPGSTHNHQSWKGGYYDHILEVMNLFNFIYNGFQDRILYMIPEEQFTLSEGLEVLFWHDVEKLWRVKDIDGHPIKDSNDQWELEPSLLSKEARKAFAAAKIEEYGVHFNPRQQNALQFVEGIRDKDYRENDRVIGPLACLCHVCDFLSARTFYNFPLANFDPWGMGRIASE